MARRGPITRARSTSLKIRHPFQTLRFAVRKRVTPRIVRRAMVVRAQVVHPVRRATRNVKRRF